LIKRAEAAVDAASAETPAEHLCRLAEKVVTQHVDGICEIRVIEEVEEFDFEL